MNILVQGIHPQNLRSAMDVSDLILISSQLQDPGSTQTTLTIPTLLQLLVILGRMAPAIFVSMPENITIEIFKEFSGIGGA